MPGALCTSVGAKSARDLEIAALAGRQHGVAARAQLVEAGLTRREIQDWLAAGRLWRLHRGVYAVGHRVLRVEGHWMAAVLACGKGAALSHQTAPAVWELRRVGSGVIHVTVPGDPGRKRREGIRLHRSVTLSRADRDHGARLPVTTVARTIIDLARTLAGRTRRTGATAPTTAASWISATSGKPDRPPYKRCYELRPGSDPKPLERTFLALPRSRDQRPEVNGSSRATSSTSSGATET